MASINIAIPVILGNLFGNWWRARYRRFFFVHTSICHQFKCTIICVVFSIVCKRCAIRTHEVNYLSTYPIFFPFWLHQSDNGQTMLHIKCVIADKSNASYTTHIYNFIQQICWCVIYICLEKGVAQLKKLFWMFAICQRTHTHTHTHTHGIAMIFSTDPGTELSCRRQNYFSYGE